VHKQIDFRFIPFGVVFIYISILLYSEFVLGSYAIIGNYFRIYPIPYFVDLEILLCGVDAIREGLDPYQAMCFEGEAYFNYPYIWGFLSVFTFFTASNHIYIGLAMLILFMAVVYKFIGKLNFKESLFYTLILISPSIMLGLERGNSDVLIFLMLMLIPLLFYRSKLGTSLIIVVASFLKLFPIGAIVAVLLGLKQTMKYKLLLFSSACLALVVYLLAFKDNIIQVSDKTPRPFKEASYGLGGLPSFVMDTFQIDSSKTWLVFLFFGLVVVAIFLLLVYKAKFSIENHQLLSDRKGIAFLMGSGIFLITCLIGYNWEYRLLFLLFAMPQVFFWIRHSLNLARLILLTYILLIWCSLIVPVFSRILPNGYANLIIYTLTISLFLMLALLYFKFVVSYVKKHLNYNSFSVKA